MKIELNPLKGGKMKHKFILMTMFILLSVGAVSGVELDENMTNTDGNDDELSLDISRESSSNLLGKEYEYSFDDVNTEKEHMHHLNGDGIEYINDNISVNETPSVSIETFISNKEIYIGNSTEVIVTVKNIGNCSIDNLSIEVECISLCYSNFQSINGFWNLNHNKTFDVPHFKTSFFVIINETRNVGHSLWFDLRNTLEVNESCSLKIIYNATKEYYYSSQFMQFDALYKDTILNSTIEKIKVNKIPANVYINRKIKNNSLILDVNVTTSDNSVFSGQLSISLAKNYNPFETFDSYRINIVNNTGHASIKLPLPFETNYGVWNPSEEEISDYSYNYIYDSFDENLVQSFLRANDLVKIYKNDSQFVVDARTEFCDNITFEINGVTYVRNVNESGFAKLNINLKPGIYTIRSYNPDNVHYMSAHDITNTITILPPIAENKNITKFYRNATQYSVKLLSDDGKAVGAGEKVIFNVNGIFYTRQTDESGIATLNINLPPSNYIITADYKGCRVANNITVLPVLNADNLKMKFGDGSQFKTNLVDGQGTPYAGQTIQFNINGVLYNRATDNNGWASLNIRLLPGEYIITSSYNGSNIANKITITG